MPPFRFESSWLLPSQRRWHRRHRSLEAIVGASEALVEAPEPRGEPEVLRLKGILCEDAVMAAESVFRQAIEAAQRNASPSFELRAATNLAQLLRAQGKATEARALLAPVYARFTEGFNTPDLKDAKAQLVALGPDVASPAQRLWQHLRMKGLSR